MASIKALLAASDAGKPLPTAVETVRSAYEAALASERPARGEGARAAGRVEGYRVEVKDPSGAAVYLGPLERSRQAAIDGWLTDSSRQTAPPFSRATLYRTQGGLRRKLEVRERDPHGLWVLTFQA